MDAVEAGGGEDEAIEEDVDKGAASVGGGAVKIEAIGVSFVVLATLEVVSGALVAPLPKPARVSVETMLPSVSTQTTTAGSVGNAVTYSVSVTVSVIKSFLMCSW